MSSDSGIFLFDAWAARGMPLRPAWLPKPLLNGVGRHRLSTSMMQINPACQTLGILSQDMMNMCSGKSFRQICFLLLRVALLMNFIIRS